jgi:glyoxylase-like metal-dependent hydrolase (beta-lactamase superfamily II)
MFKYIFYGSLKWLIPIFFFFSTTLFAFDYHLKPYKISDGIYCFFGLPSQVTHSNGGNMINSCYLESNKGYIVIDSGPTYTYAQNAYKLMEQKKKLPVRYVINTSSEEVHVLGNEFYKEQGAEILAPKDYAQYFNEKKPLELKKILKGNILENTRIIDVDRYIDKEEVLTLGDIKLYIKVAQNDNGHIYVYLKEKKIVFAGDMIFNNRMIPLKKNRSLISWEKELEKLEKLDWIDIVSAHGYKTRRSAMNHTKSYLALLKNEIDNAIKHGTSKEKILQSITLSSFSSDRLYDTWQVQNVSIAYEELNEIAKKTWKLPNHNVTKRTVIDKPIKKILKKTKVYDLKYKNFTDAMTSATKNKKIILIKVRSTNCKYCDQLDYLLENNNEVKKLLHKYFEIVKINTDYESIPLNQTVRSTPTLIFVEPVSKKILMNLHGIRAVGELLDVLNEAVTDGHNGAYLRE